MESWCIVSGCQHCKQRERVGDALSPVKLQAAIAMLGEARVGAFMAAEHTRKRSRRAYGAQLRNDLAAISTMLQAALAAVWEGSP